MHKANHGDPSSSGRADFTPTHWSIILNATKDDGSTASQALETLCKRYWYPLYVFVRRQGYTHDRAEEITQSFFAHLLSKDFLSTLNPQKGKFRSFLLKSLKNHIVDLHNHDMTIKQGGKVLIISIDAEAYYANEPATISDPERLYERRWALSVLDSVMTRLQREYQALGKAFLFEALQEVLTGEKIGNTYADLAERLGMNESAVRVTVHRMRARYRKLLRDEIALTVSSPEEVEEELRYFQSVLAR